MSSKPKNPFVLRVGQIMTGFGAGCGIGVGVGYPIALGSIPVLGDALSATTSAGSRAFGGVGHKAFGMLRKLGVKNLKAGVGCGVGIGHGFGVGFSLKPGVSQQIVQSFQERLSAVAGQLQKYLPAAEEEHIVPSEEDDLASAKTMQPTSLQNAAQMPPDNKLVKEVPVEAPEQVENSTTPAVKITSVASTFSSNEEVQDLRQENEILRMLLRHQEQIEDLSAENDSLWEVLYEHCGEQGRDLNKKVRKSFWARAAKRKPNIHVQMLQVSCRKCFKCQMLARRR